MEKKRPKKRKMAKKSLVKKSLPVWSTAHEITFIDGIGQVYGHDPTNRPANSQRCFTGRRREMLSAYIEYAENREYWGMISKAAAIAHAEEALRSGG